MLGQHVAAPRLGGHGAVARRQLDADSLGGGECHRHRRGILQDDTVAARITDAIRVLQPQLPRVHSKLGSDAVQVRFGGERHRGDAEAAHGGCWHAVRERDEAVEAQVGDRVRARVVERVLRQAVRREPRVCARVVQCQRSTAEDPAVLRDRVCELDMPRCTGRRGKELLFACPPPLDRPARLQREQRADRLGRGVDLAAEAAADGAADELQPVQRHLQVRCDDAHREVHRLRAGVDREPPVRLRHHERHLRLERHLLDRLRAVHALDDQVGLVERPVDVTLAHAPVVVRPVVRIHVAPLVDLRGVGVECLADVEERGPLLEGDLDRLDGRECRGFRVGCDRRDRLALVANLAVCEQRLIGRDAEPFEVPVNVLRNVGVRDDRADARHRLGLRCIERGDDRVMVRRPKRLHPQGLADPDVVDVLRAAGDMTDAVVAREPCADGLHAALPFETASTSPREAPMTASTIFT